MIEGFSGQNVGGLGWRVGNLLCDGGLGKLVCLGSAFGAGWICPEFFCFEGSFA